VKGIDKDWASYRKRERLDLYGKRADQQAWSATCGHADRRSAFGEEVRAWAHSPRTHISFHSRHRSASSRWDACEILDGLPDWISSICHCRATARAMAWNDGPSRAARQLFLLEVTCIACSSLTQLTGQLAAVLVERSLER